MRFLIGAAALLVLGTPFAAAAQTPRPEANPSADRPAATPAGATFTAPKAWRLRSDPRFTEVTAPEGDVSLAVVDVGEASDASAAVNAAWKLYAPSKVRAIKLLTPRAACEGWEERQVADYETSPNERRVVMAMAMRRGRAWTVLVADGAEQTFEKRGAAAALVSSSIRPAGIPAWS